LIELVDYWLRDRRLTVAHATRRDSNYGENNQFSGAVEAARAAQGVAANSRGPLGDREGRVKQTETAVGLAAAYHEAGHIVAALTQSLVDHSAAFVRTVEFRGPIAHENGLRGPKLGLGKSDYTRLCAGRAILVRLAGPAAQKRHAPRSWRSWHGESDLKQALSLASRVSSSPSAAHAFVARLGIAAEDLIEARWPIVERVANALIEGAPLSAAQIRRIAGPASDAGGFRIITPCAIA
jgi:hypothetical protein